MLSSFLSSGCDEDYFESSLYYGYSDSGKKDTSESFGLNLTFKPPDFKWLTASLSASYVLRTWEDNISGVDLIYQNRGISDSSLSGSIDFTELVDPRTDTLDLRPHFIFNAGVTLPTGSDNETYVQKQYRIPSGNQIGLGVAVPFVGLTYFQNLGNGGFSLLARISETARMKENDNGYQKPSSLSWMAGTRYAATENWSLAAFAGIGGSHTFSPTRELIPMDIPPLGIVNVLTDIPDSKADRITGNVGCTFKPWNAREWSVGVSIVFPFSTNVRDDSREMNWAGSLGLCFSF